MPNTGGGTWAPIGIYTTNSMNFTMSKLILRYLTVLCPSPVLHGTNPGSDTTGSSKLRKLWGIFPSRILSVFHRLLLLSGMPPPQLLTLSLLPPPWLILELLLSAWSYSFPSPPYFTSGRPLFFLLHLFPHYGLKARFSPSLSTFASHSSLTFPSFLPLGKALRGYFPPPFLNFPFDLISIFSMYCCLPLGVSSREFYSRHWPTSLIHEDPPVLTLLEPHRGYLCDFSPFHIPNIFPYPFGSNLFMSLWGRFVFTNFSHGHPVRLPSLMKICDRILLICVSVIFYDPFVDNRHHSVISQVRGTVYVPDPDLSVAPDIIQVSLIDYYSMFEVFISVNVKVYLRYIDILNSDHTRSPVVATVVGLPRC